MKTSITMICHGATSANRTASFPADEPLDARSVQWTPMLRRSLARADRVLMSPCLRAGQTAELLGLVADIEPSLRECDHGHWTGKTFQAVAEQDPEGLSLWMNDFEVAPHGGEPMSALLMRASDWLAANLDTGGHTIAITHASVIRACLMDILAAPTGSYRNIDVEPLSLTHLSSDGRRWGLRIPKQKIED